MYMCAYTTYPIKLILLQYNKNTTDKKKYYLYHLYKLLLIAIKKIYLN